MLSLLLQGSEFVAYDNSEIVPQSVWWCSAALGLEGLYSTPSAASASAASSASANGASSNASSGSGAASYGGGQVYHMVTYVPIDAASDTSTQVRLDLFQTEYDNRKRSVYLSRICIDFHSYIFVLS
jgi:hypothetical protein